jgi:hypothetical protein
MRLDVLGQQDMSIVLGRPRFHLLRVDIAFSEIETVADRDAHGIAIPCETAVSERHDLTQL